MPSLAAVVGAQGIASTRALTGVVVSAGQMEKCVKVRIARQVWNKHLHKHFDHPYNILVSDPSSSTRLGDVVSIQNGWRTSRHVRHVVNSIVAPMGSPLAERPAIPSEAERLASAEAKRAAKDARQAARGRGESARRMKMWRAREHMQRVEMGVLGRKLREVEDGVGEVVQAVEALRGEEERELRRALEGIVGSLGDVAIAGNGSEDKRGA